jgi:short-subunit dehydrogenase
MASTRPLAVVTGASSGIGYELAKKCAQHGMDLIIAADESAIEQAAQKLSALDVDVKALEVNLATQEGVDKLVALIKRGGKPVDCLLANAGQGEGGAFLEQDFVRLRDVINTNITGTIYLIQRLAPDMVKRKEGRILITGSIAGFIPGSFAAVYNGTKAFIDSFSFALREEIKDTGVTVTCLMPGATDTEFFERAGMEDTAVGIAKKDSPALVAEIGFDAMMDGQGDVVTGWKNKLQTAMASVTPAGVLAAQHRKQAEPGSGKS